jgi:uncharacterized damage-inducible protein DinB
MTRDVLDYVIWEMGQAFDTLFHNLKDLRDDDWTWIPPGGARSISAIVGHIASSKVMYDNHAFGDASLTWESPLFNDAQSPTTDRGLDPGQLFEWLRESHLRLLKNVDALADDTELERRRPVNWGGTRETRWIITRLINHDGYHAGEINHLRSIHQQNDRWEWEQEPSPE